MANSADEGAARARSEIRTRPVRALPGEVARKIAAGEVIDRPAACVRELLDNSIDSGATRITVELTGGGVDRIRVVDNGAGMTRDDLAICTDTHTTSKISVEDDLLALATLGFRGEALSSIKAVSNLEITTTRDGREAWKLENGAISPARLPSGTIVQIDGLFADFPARRQFLKRASAETTQCKQIFIEKALAWPDREFRLTVDGAQKMSLPVAESLRERSLAALGPKEPESFFHEILGSGEGFSFTAVIGTPDVVRADRRDIMIFINGRRIMEYSLLQAIEYGTEGHFPNGGHPFACLFVTIDPALVDFNIHPAKREARFRDGAALHHAVSSTVREFFRRYTIASLSREVAETKTEESGFLRGFDEPALRDSPAREIDSPGERFANQGQTEYRNSGYSRNYGVTGESSRHGEVAYREERYASAFGGDVRATANEREPSREQTAWQTQTTSGDFRYLGQVLGTFLAVERNGLLYLIDQHAAHERILYDRLMSERGNRQELLVPYRIETAGDAENERLAEMSVELAEAGFCLADEGDGVWQITAVPARWTGSQKDLAAELAEGIASASALVSHLYATSACRAACKDGDTLDDGTALELVAKAFELEEPVCPHGRPIWIIMDRDDLFRRIRRT